MRCFHPVTAFQPDGGGPILFHEVRNSREIQIPCGQCIGCRLKRSESWATRCMHESRMHRDNCFITLTYEHENLPQYGSLHYPDFQKFCKRVRKKKGPFRFFMCGEYGEQFLRPHYHACLFGLCFSDLKLFSTSGSGNDVFISQELSELWPHGHASVGSLTWESAAYVARYCVKKVTGQLADDHYKRLDMRTGEVNDVVPEFGHMSLRPGIGASFFAKYSHEILVRDACIVRGKARQVPRYYDKLLAAEDPDAFEGVQYDRLLARLESKEVITERSLLDQEIVTKAGLSFKKRIIE